MLFVQLIFILTIAKTSLSQNGVIKPRFFMNGMGYSDDSESLAKEPCFNIKYESSDNQRSEVKLDQAVSFSEFKKEFEAALSVGGSYNIFSGDTGFKYLKNVEEKEHTISLNYYYFVKKDINLVLAGSGEKALNPQGLSYYKDQDGKYFGVLCGNQYINSYQRGAFLTMGFYLEFKSSEEKNTFSQNANLQAGNFVKAAESLSQSISKSNYKINLYYKAFQLGGDASQLSTIFGSGDENPINSLECDNNSMDKCKSVAARMLIYAGTSFPAQLKDNEKSYIPLGITKQSFTPIRTYGLIWRPLVTDEIKQWRQKLRYTLEANEYYKEKLYSLFNGYPVEFFAEFEEKLQALSNRVNKNLKALENSAIECWTQIEDCPAVAKNLMEKVSEITSKDLEFLKPIKYYFTIAPFLEKLMKYFLINKGKDCYETCWSIHPYKIFETHLVLKQFSYNERQYSYKFLINSPSFEPIIYEFSGNTNDEGRTFTGNVSRYSGSKLMKVKPLKENRKISSFYFELYKNK